MRTCMRIPDWIERNERHRIFLYSFLCVSLVSSLALLSVRWCGSLSSVLRRQNGNGCFSIRKTNTPKTSPNVIMSLASMGNKCIQASDDATTTSFPASTLWFYANVVRPPLFVFAHPNKPIVPTKRTHALSRHAVFL